MYAIYIMDFIIDISIHLFIFSGKTKQGRNGISGFVQNILSSKKKASNLKRGNNLPTMRIQVLEFVGFQTFVTVSIKPDNLICRACFENILDIYIFAYFFF